MKTQYENSNRAARLRWPPLAIALATIAFAAAIILAHALLIPMGSWRVDEYHDFGLFRDRGWSYFVERLLTWSPRPLSETLVGLYFLAEQGLRRQLLVPFLAVMWAPLLIGPLLFLRQVRTRGQGLAGAVIATSVLALFLLGHPVAEMLYWPMGAVAYATTLAAIAAIAFQVAAGLWDRPGGRRWGVVFALCAAGSAELGAIFAIYIAIAMIALHLTDRVGTRSEARLWLLPLLLGIAVMLLLALGRGRLEEHVIYRGMEPNLRHLGHPLASLHRALSTYAREIVVLSGTEKGLAAFALGFVVKALAFTGFLGCLVCLGYDRPGWNQPGRASSDQTSPDQTRLDRPQRPLLVAAILSLQATIFTSIAGSYYKFGLVCCERHDTVRQCMIVLTLMAGAALAAAYLPPRRPKLLTAGPGALLLALALLILTIQRAPDLAAAYQARPTIVAIRHDNWNAGTAPGGWMTFLMAPLPPIVQGMAPPERGIFRQSPDTPWLWDLVMTFFRKTTIELKPVQPQP